MENHRGVRWRGQGAGRRCRERDSCCRASARRSTFGNSLAWYPPCLCIWLHIEVVRVQLSPHLTFLDDAQSDDLVNETKAISSVQPSKVAANENESILENNGPPYVHLRFFFVRYEAYFQYLLSLLGDPFRHCGINE